MRRSVAISLVLLCGLDRFASADDATPSESHDLGVAPTPKNRVALSVAPPSMTAPEPAPAPAEPPAPDGIAGFVASDASAGHAYVTSTALTAPKGQTTLSGWAPAVPVGGAFVGTYAVTSRIEIGAGAVMSFEDVDDDDGVAWVLTGKAQLVRGRTGAVSVELRHVAFPDDDQDLTIAQLAGSKCLDGARCRTLGTLHVHAVPVTRYDTETLLYLVPGASLIHGGKWKAVMDLAHWNNDYERTTMIYGGVRYGTAGLSADAGVAFAVTSDQFDTRTVPAPLIGGSARF